MCQHRVTNENTEYFYGFDNFLEEFFIIKDFEEDETILVGSGGEFPGTHGYMLDQIYTNSLEDLIPPEHLKKIGLDLPCCDRT
jgi:hypothetical protein